MFDKYSGDESFGLFVSGVLGLIAWVSWYYNLVVTSRKIRAQGQRWPLAVVPLVCALLIFYVLRHFSAEDVRSDSDYILFYLVLGAGWLGLFRVLLPLLGLSPRDDVLERGNNSALPAVVGALLGASCCFAGANVGNGPGWWVVLLSGLLSTGALVAVWSIVHLGSGLAEKITIERDLAAGLRAAGLLIAAGLIFGKAVAGDWVSVSATTTDFARRAWPGLVLAAAAIVVERCCASNLSEKYSACVTSGWLPAFVYIAAGVVVSLFGL